MSRILITGGTGEFGRHLIPFLQAQGHTLRLVSRRAQPADAFPQVEWAQAELGADAGWAAALHDAPVIVHAASDPAHSRAVDVAGTRHLLTLARQAKVLHFFYISIVGVERHPLPYYQDKLAVEGLLRASGLPYTIFRATQFHSFIDGLFTGFLGGRLPFGFVPTDFQTQPIATAEAAQAAAHALASGPQELLPDVGGPEVLTFGEMLAPWQAARHQQKWVVPLWVPLGWAANFRRGDNTCPARKVGHLTWSAWLQEQYAPKER